LESRLPESLLEALPLRPSAIALLQFDKELAIDGFSGDQVAYHCKLTLEAAFVAAGEQRPGSLRLSVPDLGRPRLRGCCQKRECLAEDQKWGR